MHPIKEYLYTEIKDTLAITNVILPKLGESIVEATVLKILKQVGDAVKMDDTLMEIATDKVDSEVPSTAEGIIEEILCKEGDVVKIGAVIVKIRTSKEETKFEQSKTPAAIHVNGNGKQPIQEKLDTHVPYLPSSQVVKKPEGSRFYSPLVMNIASSEGIALSELENMIGTGSDGRVTKTDILQYISNKKSGQSSSLHGQTDFSSMQQPAQQFYSGSGNVDVIEMDRMRKLIADHMTKSKSTSAHVTSFAEADVTNMVTWRDANKVNFEKREGEKITFTPLFIEAIVKCLKKYPLLNSSVVGNEIHIKRDINIGMATALPNGNLIVPVIQQADQFNIIGLTKQVNRLANSARNGKLQPNDTQNGTFTFTNIGTFGSIMGTPIINQPQVAILAIGVIKKKPVVIETDQGDSVGVRQMMFVSMSYDHRIIDGALGSMFLNEFVKHLEAFDPNREI
jgi:2-oxoglutarate dehydrogenase E2 component (dihydrolipoamide succinyltransferase)